MEEELSINKDVKMKDNFPEIEQKSETSLVFRLQI